jgi:exodeoxyribonuclease VII large subunit
MEKIKLSELTGQIRDTIQDQFEGELYWVTAQITNVKKQEASRRCYLTLEEYENGEKTAEIKAVFWSAFYGEIEKFEQQTRQPFKNGIEITCLVRVRYHPVYGLSLEILKIEIEHVEGSVELERRQTLERLLKENPQTIQLFDGIYRTYNNRLPLPLTLKRIALVTAPNSDGQRDFLQEIRTNKHSYAFSVEEFLTTIQGENAHNLILEQLKMIELRKEQFDVVAIVRGGGSETDFKPFEHYELAKSVAEFPIPVITGIGHDRNQSIVDLMAREQKTPTKVGSFIVDHNFEFENRLIEIISAISLRVNERIRTARDRLNHARRILNLSSTESVLKRGFAILSCNGKIIADPKDVEVNAEIEARLEGGTITSRVTGKVKM